MRNLGYVSPFASTVPGASPVGGPDGFLSGAAGILGSVDAIAGDVGALVGAGGGDVDEARRSAEGRAQLTGKSACQGGTWNETAVGRMAEALPRSTVEQAMQRYKDCRGDVAWSPGQPRIGSAVYFGTTISSKRQAGRALAALANGGPDCGEGGAIGGGGGAEGASCAAGAVRFIEQEYNRQGGEPSNPRLDPPVTTDPSRREGGSQRSTRPGPSGGEDVGEQILSILGRIVRPEQIAERAEGAVEGAQRGAGAGVEATSRRQGLQMAGFGGLLVPALIVGAVVFLATR